jgi:hypothetical protein
MNIDISNKIGKEKPTLTIAEGKTYTVDNSAETVLLMQNKVNGEEMGIETMYDVITCLLGDDALAEIKEIKPSVTEIQTIITALMALVQEIPLEEAEKRFQNAK